MIFHPAQEVGNITYAMYPAPGSEVKDLVLNQVPLPEEEE